MTSGRVPGDRRKSFERASFVRERCFLYTVRIGPKISASFRNNKGLGGLLRTSASSIESRRFLLRPRYGLGLRRDERRDKSPKRVPCFLGKAGREKECFCFSTAIPAFTELPHGSARFQCACRCALAWSLPSILSPRSKRSRRLRRERHVRRPLPQSALSNRRIDPPPSRF